MTESSVPIRLLDLGTVDPVRSQTIYHAVGYSMTPTSPDTIMLVSPDAPYVSIGRHQDVDREVDRAVCADLGFPIIRREIGGGAVYLDGNQLFTQWIFAADHLPPTVEGRFALYCDTLVQTYRALGIEAAYRPVNDIHVNGRKIGGTGAARMDNAEVVVGSLMFDFDILTMSRVLKVPSEKFRDKVYQTLSEYMTTMTRELGEAPDRAPVIEAYVATCSAALGRPIELGSLRDDELALADQLDARFASLEWLEEGGGLRRAGVKIHEGVHVAEGATKAPGGMIRCVAVIRDDTLDDISFSGDFTARPAEMPQELAAALVGCAVVENAIQERVSDYYLRVHPETPGVSASDWVTAILQATATSVPA
ncbi:MAG: biotin/lipoate A/B protein ligase family protein [Candidatus Limnocylindrales bacterium]